MDEAEGKVVNLSMSNLDLFPDVEQADIVSELLLQHNRITILPRCICDFQNGEITHFAAEQESVNRAAKCAATSRSLDNRGERNA